MTYATEEDAAQASRPRAYVVPFLTFMAFLLVTGLLNRLAADLGWGRHLPILLRSEFWVYPVQTLLCGYLVWRYRRAYDFGPPAVFSALAVGTIALVLWIAPQQWFGAEPRTEGFDPTHFQNHPTLYALTVAFRFLRLVVVVPLVEEIFWRGFLMRYLIQEDFQRVPFGAFQWKSFLAVAVLFMLVHSTSDYPAAFLTGLLYNGLACRTRSLMACVLAHAFTNLLLGLYIMKTQQWGFW
jgi:CAAX prenyl protease-like protein